MKQTPLDNLSDERIARAVQLLASFRRMPAEIVVDANTYEFHDVTALADLRNAGFVQAELSDDDFVFHIRRLGRAKR